MGKDYYKILGIDKGATKDDIKRAYKKLAKKYHPDISKESNAAEKFKEVNEAASVLGDDQKRQQYDQFGSDFVNQRGGFGGFDPNMFRDFSFNFDDIFDTFFGGGRGFGGFGRRRAQPRGSDLRYDLTITLEEASQGLKRNIKIVKNAICDTCNGKGGTDFEKCPQCHGQGRIIRQSRTPFGMFQTSSTCQKCRGEREVPKHLCKKCHGEGIIDEEKELEVKIPAGVDNNSRLRIHNEGEAVKGGIPGDLYIFITVKKHKYFQRDGADLYLETHISFAEASLGTEIEVPTIDGKANLKIPPGTQPGTLMRMRGKGMPRLHGSGRGEQLIKVRVEVPKRLSKKQKDILKQLDKENKKKCFLDRVFKP